MGAMRKVEIRLDEAAFLEEVSRTIGDGVAAAVATTLAGAHLTPELADRLLQLGGCELASQKLNLERERIIRTVTVRTVREPRMPPKVLNVTVVRSPMRDWPVSTRRGVVAFEECTPDQVRHEIDHLTRTIAGLERHRAPLVRAVEAADRLGVTRMGDLPDDVLDACLMSAEGDDHDAS